MVLKIILGDVGIRKDPNGGYNPVITIPLNKHEVFWDQWGYISNVLFAIKVGARMSVLMGNGGN